MKPRRQNFRRSASRLQSALSTLTIAVCLTGAANAASQAWRAVPADATWAGTSNWGATGTVTPPGIFPTTNATNTADVATFNAALSGGIGGSGNPIVIDANRMIGSLLFDTANAGSYVVGTNTSLQVGNNLSITVNAAVVNPQTVNANLQLHLPSSTNGAYTIQNNSTTSTATLTLQGSIGNPINSTRGTAWTIGGTNTGTNTISSNITLTTTGNIASTLTKTGAGRWILSGTNSIGGGSTISAGTLVAQSVAALGVAANGVTVNGGTLQLDGIVLNNNLATLNSGTIKSNGTSTINGVTVGAAATAVNLGTTSSGDVFTVGNAANKLTGTNTASVISADGPGTISLPFASNYAGGWSLNTGTVQLGNNSALGAAASVGVTFGPSSTATLKLNGFSPTISRLSTNATTGTPVIVNGNSGTSTLTVNTSVANTFAGALNDGSSGVLALTKSGSGSLTLSGTNGYTGDTTISAGTLSVNGSAATPAVAVNSGSTLSGTGSISGTVTVASTSRLAPGNGVGTLTMGALTLSNGSIVDCEFKTGPAANDLAVVTNSDGLILDGGGFNLFQEGTTTQFSTPGTYTLISYTGTSNVSTSNLSVLNPDATKNYSFTSDATSVKLTITASVISNWALTSGGDWATGGNWTGAGVPNASGSTAIFGSAATSPATITLNGDKTVSTLAFDNANAYTIAPATTETLFLDNTANAGQAQIIGTSGSHVISAPVSLTSNTVASIANSLDTISLTGIVSGAGSLSKSGPGTLHLGAVNTYSGGTTISNGTLSFATGGISTAGPISISTSTLRWATGNTDDLSLAPLVSLPAGNATFDTNGNDVAFTSGIGDNGAGNLVKTGAGKLSLAGGSSYGGTTTINSGTLSIAADSSLGTAPGTATPGEITIGSATLQSTANLTIATNRGIDLTSATSAIDAASGSTLTYNGIIAGSGKLNLTGTINLGGANTHSGGTVIEAGALVTLNSGTAQGSGQTELRDGQVTINAGTSSITNLLVDTGKTGVVVDGALFRPGVSGLTGAGDVTFITRSGGTNAQANAFGFRLQGSYAGFTGTLRLKSGVANTLHTFPLHFNGGGGFNGNMSGATVILSDYARVAGVNGSAGNTVTIGALSGDATTVLAGADYAGFNTYNIGAKNLDTTFDGLISNGSAGNANLIKSGTGTLTLTAANTYDGSTTVSSGTLAITNASGLGADTIGTTITGGDVNGRLSVSGGLTITEPLTLGGRQGANFESAHVLNASGNNQFTAAVTPATGGNNFNIQSDAGLLTMAGSFTPAGAVTGARFLQLLGDGNGAWTGAINNGTATVHLIKLGAGTWTLSGTNTYTGDTTVDGGTLALSSTSELKFAPTTNGTSNKVAGSAAVTLDGTFNIDLTAANVTNGNSWLLVDVDNLTETFGSTFAVTGFTKSGTNWTKVDGANTWTFSQTTGALTLAVVSDPFVTWIDSFFPGETNAAIVGKAADPDNDGRNNLAEFAFNSSPTSAVNDGKVVGKTATVGGNSVLTLTLPVRTGATFTDDVVTHEEVSGLIDGVIYRIQGSDDLTAWTLDVSEVGAGAELDAIQAGLPTPGTGWTYRTFRAPGTVSSSTSDFLRIKVTE